MMTRRSCGDFWTATWCRINKLKKEQARLSPQSLPALGQSSGREDMRRVEAEIEACVDSAAGGENGLVHRGTSLAPEKARDTEESEGAWAKTRDGRKARERERRQGMGRKSEGA